MSRFPAPAEAMEEHSAIIGKTGAGKTYTAKGFAEDLLTEGSRFCVIDPTGVWWGLKSSADGESEGFPVVVFGGDHGDVPLDENDGEAVARIVATTATPCVIDVSAFPSLAAQKRFITEFAEHLFRLNREALHLFVDEADAFMPQRPGPDEMVMLGRWDTIARRGRSRGFRLTLITQRPAVLNKNALSQVGTLIALKLTSPQDRKAVGDWIEGNADKTEGKALLASLPSLNRGEGWVWSPGHDVLERVQFQPITTWDSSRTPGKGEIHREAKTMARADIAAILAVMSTPKAQQPGEVRTQPDADALRAAREDGHAKGLGEGIAASAEKLTALTTALRQSQGVVVQAIAYVQSVGDMLTEHSAAVAREFPEVRMGIGENLDRLGAEFMRTSLEGWRPSGQRFDLGSLMANLGESPNVVRRMAAEMDAMPETRPVERQDAPPAPSARQPVLRCVPGGPTLTPAATRMALALAARWPSSITRKQWATLAKVAEGGGTFSTALKMLREADFYADAAGRVDSTEACRLWAAEMNADGAAGEWASEFVMWCAHLPTTAIKVFEALRDLGGSATRAALATTAGLAVGGGTFSTALKVLHDNELLTAKREGGVLHETSDLARREADRLKRKRP